MVSDPRATLAVAVSSFKAADMMVVFFGYTTFMRSFAKRTQLLHCSIRIFLGRKGPSTIKSHPRRKEAPRNPHSKPDPSFCSKKIVLACRFGQAPFDVTVEPGIPATGRQAPNQ
jgi:hypothetical protein